MQARARFIVLSGCSGGGKSTLLEELRQRGYPGVPEPGLRVLQEEMKHGGCALPWIDLAAFARRCYQLALSDVEQAKAWSGQVFFDRGLVDASVALSFATGESLSSACTEHYSPLCFLVPPWREIFINDAARQHSFESAVAEFERLHEAYERLGFTPVLVPRTNVQDRASFVLGAVQTFLSHTHNTAAL